MKRIIFLIMSLVILSVSVTPVYADECRHEYIPELFAADCLQPERTVYTCRYCGDSYTKYAWEYKEPDGFGILFDTQRDDENLILTMTATVFNNPGLIISLLNVSYDGEVLSPISYENGEVWDSSDYPFQVNLANNPMKIYTERLSTELNTKSGKYFTITFRILDPDGDYGFGYRIIEKNFVDWDGHFYMPQAIDITGKRELGGHSFEERTEPATCTVDGCIQQACSVCGTVRESEIIPATGHSYGKAVIVQPSVNKTVHGTAVKTCAFCGDEVFLELPFKADVNNDGKRNSVDANLIKRYVTGALSTKSEQIRYALDINEDNKINAVDVNLLKSIILGSN